VENEEQSIEQPVGETYTTAHNHFWVEDIQQDPNSDLISCRCTGCPAGSSIDPKVTKIVDGRMEHVR
jgi:hypothetical protein